MLMQTKIAFQTLFKKLKVVDRTHTTIYFMQNGASSIIVLLKLALWSFALILSSLKQRILNCTQNVIMNAIKLFMLEIVSYHVH